MKLHVLCIAYEQPVALRVLCDSFLLQTDHRWALTVVHDGPPSEMMKKTFELYDDPRITFLHSPERVQHWGNPLRRTYLANIKGDIDDYVLITNHDNYYVPRFVEFMLSSGNMDTGIIYCNTVHNHLTYSGQISSIRVGKIDGGALIVHLELAQKVGYQHNIGHADGLYAVACKRECIKRGQKIVQVNKFLFVHN